MPKIKIERIISFSTEDPVHEANNILSSDPSKKWKCQKEGEKSVSIVLQLEQPSVISSIDIGNEHSAYVEVLVNRSSASDDFKVLLVMSSFMSPLESRQSTNVNKVRMFGCNELQSPERDQKWDRIKIVCTQPFNRHVQYGLSFVTLHSLEGKESVGSGTPGNLGKFLLRPDSPDNLRTGSLFARRKELADDTPRTAAAAIREASSSTFNANSPKCKPRLKDAIITPSKQDVGVSNKTPTSRNRNELLYSKDEEEVDEKIEKLIEQKNKELKEKQVKEEEEAKNKKQKQAEKKVAQISNKQDKKQEKKLNTSNKHENNKLDTPSSSSASTSKRKTNENTPSTSKKIKIDKQTKPFSKLLNGVTIVISGIQNPERADIRSNALELGAHYKADWDSSCTHLICAFTNTPKYNQVKGKGKIVNRLWIQDCYTRRKRLPWRRYALDRKELSANESEEEIWEERPKSPELKVLFTRGNDISDEDTDIDGETEISIVSFQNAKDKLNRSGFSTDTEEETIKPKKANALPKLPDFLKQKTVYIDSNLAEKDRLLLSRYVVSFNGLVLEEPDDIVDFVIATRQNADVLKTVCPDAFIVKPDWVIECHNEKRLIPPNEYQL